jgi:hypothetical protein
VAVKNGAKGQDESSAGKDWGLASPTSKIVNYLAHRDRSAIAVGIKNE